MLSPVVSVKKVLGLQNKESPPEADKTKESFKQILKEIKQFQAFVLGKKKEEKSEITLIEDLNYKVQRRQNLIRITNEQANLLTREISVNQQEITSLRAQLKELKDDYAAMIVKSYKSKSEQSKVRELHVYGKMVPSYFSKILESNTQHKGIGTRLMKMAEAYSIHNSKYKVSVISGVGVRNFYRKLGYHNENDYMVKYLHYDYMYRVVCKMIMFIIQVILKFIFMLKG